MENFNNYIFLLGGNDLEMEEIRSMLTGKMVFPSENEKLSWGAKLSSYASHFDNTHTFVGIELIPDCPTPTNYIEIDHHNDKSNLPSSIEQVASLLDVSLSVWQQLVAVNDTGYIPALKAAGLSHLEIQKIRKADRVAQGATDQDDIMAAESIKDHCYKIGSLLVVESSTPFFSCITDILYPFEELIIRHKTTFTYYGGKTPFFTHKYADLVKDKKAYSGGQSNNFFGIDEKAFTIEEADILYKEVLNQIQLMETHSYHIFMFPFRLEKKELKSNKKKDVALQSVFNSILDLQDWQDEELGSETAKYNHQKYFYNLPVLQDGFAKIQDTALQKEKRDIVNCFIHYFAKIKDAFLQKQNEETKPLFKQLIAHKRYKVLKDAKYSIHLHAKIKEIVPEPLLKDAIIPPRKPKFEYRDFHLKIDKICLDIYQDDIAILSFHLQNDKYSDPNDILLINQYGRRIYPPFIDTHFSDFQINLTKEIDGTKHRELANEISITASDLSHKMKEDFTCLKTSIGFSWPKHLKFLFKPTEAVKIKPLLDDRMFVMCWYGSPQLGYKFDIRKLDAKVEEQKYKYCISQITKRVKGGYEVTSAYRNTNQHRSLSLNTSVDGYGYMNSDFWYQYVFVDGISPSCANELMKQKQLQAHTYDRWVGNNTLYGISRFSFVCITEPISNLMSPEINAAFIPEHVRTIYFRMVVHNLAQRASILGFSEKISLISFQDSKEYKQEKRNIALDLYKDYRHFIDNIYYREVTDQEQGIELYDMLQDHLRIKDQAKELEKEFIEMNRLVELIGTNETNKRMRVLTVMGTVFTTFSILFSLQSSQYFKGLSGFNYNDILKQPFCWDCAYPIVMISTMAYFLVNGLLIWYLNKSRSLIFLGFSVLCFFIYLITFNMQPAINKVFVSIGMLTLSVLITQLISKFSKKNSK